MEYPLHGVSVRCEQRVMTCSKPSTVEHPGGLTSEQGGAFKRRTEHPVGGEGARASRRGLADSLKVLACPASRSSTEARVSQLRPCIVLPLRLQGPAQAGWGTGWSRGGGARGNRGAPREPWSWGGENGVEGPREQSELRQAAGDSPLL